MIVVDTHVLVWMANEDSRLGNKAGRLLETEMRTDRLGVSAITPWEIALLVDKGRLLIAQELEIWMNAILQAPGVELLPIVPSIAIGSVRLPGSFHADPADRLLLATARHWSAPVVTADRAILDYARQGHVRTIDAGG